MSGPRMGGECDCDPAARARSEIGDGRDDGDTQREVVTGEGTLTALLGWLWLTDDHNEMKIAMNVSKE